ncbi:MAG: SDR family NAD(P)-dependent oxidoreductase [Pseudomonadota bacterium]
MLDFSKEVVLVTGGATGIGFGIVQSFLEAGARVVIGDIRQAALDGAVARLGSGDRVFAGTVDVRDGVSVDRFLTLAEAALGPVSVVVANAGVYPNTLVLEMTEKEWDEVMDVNARGVFLTCQAVARRMVGRGAGGRIITIASASAWSGRRGAAHYCASKAAVVMFTKVLALELAQNRINVNAISPGLVDTQSEISPMSREYIETLSRTIPWGRIATPQDIAKAAMFLASPLAEYVTGEVLSVDGGAGAGRTSLPSSTPQPQQSVGRV